MRVPSGGQGGGARIPTWGGGRELVNWLDYYGHRPRTVLGRAEGTNRPPGSRPSQTSPSRKTRPSPPPVPSRPRPGSWILGRPYRKRASPRPCGGGPKQTPQESGGGGQAGAQVTHELARREHHCRSRGVPGHPSPPPSPPEKKRSSVGPPGRADTTSRSARLRAIASPLPAGRARRAMHTRPCRCRP